MTVLLAACVVLAALLSVGSVAVAVAAAVAAAGVPVDVPVLTCTLVGGVALIGDVVFPLAMGASNTVAAASIRKKHFILPSSQGPALPLNCVTSACTYACTGLKMG